MNPISTRKYIPGWLCPGLKHKNTKEEMMMMKKRLLALALSLVLMTSLLPITAAAEDYDFGSVFVGLENGGVYCEDVQFELHLENYPAELSGFVAFKISPDAGSGGMVMTSDGDGKYTLHVSAGIEHPHIMIMRNDGEEMDVLSITLKNGHNWRAWTSNGDGTHSRTCGNGCVDSPQKDYCADNNADCKCDDCGASMHFWQYTRTENSLTAECGNSGCTIGKVGVTLTASSVTLPNSPFNAQLTFEGDFKEAFRCSEIEYQYEDPTTGWDYVDPNTFTPKPGNYQAGVLISGLPGNGEIAARSLDSNNYANQGSEYLYVKYTAADPAITAQTGDDRPIELMMVGVLVFSALASAAFLLDHKRKYSR